MLSRLHSRLTQRVLSSAAASAASSSCRSLHTNSILPCGVVAFVADHNTRRSVQQRLAGASASSSSSQTKFSPPPSSMPTLMQDALQTLNHRGPDHTGSWISADGTMGLGHTRLSIIDLSPAGNQPLSNHENDVHAVVNGEIYDFEKERSKLSAKGVQFKSNSDSEVALAMYCQYGINFVSEIRGEFAITIVDEAQGIFHAVRDRFGIKPLYYARHGGRWLFASEMKALFKLGVEPVWNMQAIASNSAFWHVGPVFEGIHELPPGHYATVSRDGSLRLTKYWDQDYPDRSIPDNRTDKEMIDGVRERIKDAIRVRMRSDVPVAVYLSGGVDSCTTLGAATEINEGKPLHAFNISFSTQPRFDEGKLAELQAKKSGAHFHKLHVSENDIATNLEKSLWHYEQALFNTNAVSKFMLSKYVNKEGIKVVLTGEGSDEIFGGYVPFRADLARYGDISDEQKTAIIDSLKKGNLWVDRIGAMPEKQQQVLNHTLGYIPEYIRTFPPHLLNDAFIPEVMDQVLSKKSDFIQYLLSHYDGHQLRKMREKWEVVHSSLYVENTTLLPATLLTTLGDRSEMAHSVEGRTPFLDHHLVEYVNNLPSRVKINGTREKWILREAAKDWITEESYAGSKHPFWAPPAFLNPKTQLHDLVQSTLRSPDMQKLWWVDQKKIVAQLDGLTKMMQKVLPNLATVSQQERDAYLATIIGADAKFIALVSYAMLQKQFNVKY